MLKNEKVTSKYVVDFLIKVFNKRHAHKDYQN